MIPYGRQDINQSDIDAVAAVLSSDFLTQGPAVPRFEQAIADFVGAAYGVAVNSATSALHLACLALGLKPGGRVWTVPNTFVASANCARYCGAEVDFVDIDPDTLNLSVQALQEKLEHAERRGLLPDIVIPVHFAGLPCDMAAIGALAKRYGFAIIEDASHAIGAVYGDERTGACTYSDITVFSFHPVKILTTGEGGMLLTNSPALCDKIKCLRSHGITRDQACMESKTDGDWYYQQIDLGYNYRMTDIQAALGLSQLERLDAFLVRRRQLAERYRNIFVGWPLQWQKQAENTQSAYHLFPVRVGSKRKQVFEHLRSAGIGVNVHYIPVHTQPYYTRLGFSAGMYPEAERYYAEAISLPMFASLSDAEQDQVAESLKQALNA